MSWRISLDVTQQKSGFATILVICILAGFLWIPTSQSTPNGSATARETTVNATGDTFKHGEHTGQAASDGTSESRDSLIADEENLSASLIDTAGLDFVEATKALCVLNDPASRLNTIDALVSNWGESDVSSALEFAATLEDEAEQQIAIAAAMRGHAHKAPRSTLKLADELLGPSYAYDRLAFTVLQSWTQSSPGEALDWAAAHLAPALRTQAFGTFLRSWADENPDAAVAWVGSLGSSVVKQEALQALGAL